MRLWFCEGDMKLLLKSLLALPKNVLVKLKQRMNVPVPSTRLALVVALAIPVFYNVTLWVNAWNTMATFSIKALGFCLALYALMALLLLVLCVLLSHRWVFKPLLIILIMSSAAVAYFNSIGVVIDEAMLKNIAKKNMTYSFVNRPSVKYDILEAVDYYKKTPINYFDL